MDNLTANDRTLMRRCIRCGESATSHGDVPIGALVADGDEVLAEAGNSIRASGELTGHAELNAIAAARRRRGGMLSGCTLYTTVEPCAMCAFCIREAGLNRVVFALSSPVMGRLTRWNVLRDSRLCNALPEVFGPVPEVVAGFLASEAAEVWRRWHPLAWAMIERRGYLAKVGEGDAVTRMPRGPGGNNLRRVLAWLHRRR